MITRCPRCRNPIVQSWKPCGDHWHEWYVCLCGLDLEAYEKTYVRP